MQITNNVSRIDSNISNKNHTEKRNKLKSYLYGYMGGIFIADLINTTCTSTMLKSCYNFFNKSTNRKENILELLNKVLETTNLKAQGTEIIDVPNPRDLIKNHGSATPSKLEELKNILYKEYSQNKLFKKLAGKNTPLVKNIIGAHSEILIKQASAGKTRIICQKLIKF